MSFECLHFQHDSPGDFAVRCLEFCRSLCARYQVPLEVAPIEARELMRRGDLSWEAAAHRLRYRAVAERRGLFLTAHTEEDQAETVVMRLLEGAGLAGLSGIRKTRNDGVERPLLMFSRRSLREYLTDIGESWLEDPTNVDGNDRARVRHEIMPALLKLRPSFVSSVSRTASQLAQDEDALTEIARDWMRHFGKVDHWPLLELRALLPALRHRVLREIYRQASDGTHRRNGAVLRQADGLVMRPSDDRRIFYPGNTLLCKTGKYVWLARNLELGKGWSVDIPKSLSQPMGQSGWSLVPPGCDQVGEGFRLPLPAGVFQAGEQYQVRGRRPKDVYRGQSLKKFLARSGQPPWIRDRWPLLARGAEVLGVPGLDSGEGEGEGSLFFSPQRWRWAPEKDEVQAPAEKETFPGPSGS